MRAVTTISLSASIGIICKYVYDLTNDGGCLYFMQREKNAGFVLQILSQTGWEFQNLII
jgi:hypothetical protein